MVSLQISDKLSLLIMSHAKGCYVIYSSSVVLSLKNQTYFNISLNSPILLGNFFSDDIYLEIKRQFDQF